MKQQQKNAENKHADLSNKQKNIKHSAPVSAQKQKHPVLDAQEVIGNHGLLRISEGQILQRKLKIGSSNSRLEKQAEEMANYIVNTSNHTSPIQKTDNKVMPVIQKKSVADSQQTYECVPDIVNNVISSGSGRPLDSKTKDFMESKFGGESFDNVRIYTSNTAAESANSVNANAYTIGNNIVFNHGKFFPNTSRGLKLLAHELAHVIQQKKQPTNSNTISTYHNPLVIHRTQSVSTTKKASVSLPVQHLKTTQIIKMYTIIDSVHLNLIKKDVEEIRNILLEYYISDKDEKKIITKFNFWNYCDEQRNQKIQWLVDNYVFPEWPSSVSKTMYLDRFIDESWQRTFWKSTTRTAGIKQFTDVYHDLFRELEDENLGKYKFYLRKSKANIKYAQNKVSKFPNFWVDVGWTTVKGLPGGAGAAVGGSLKSLPFGIGERASEVLVEGSKEYLRVVDYGDEKMIKTAIGYSELVGEGFGHGIQSVAGSHLIKAISTGGKVLKGGKAIEVGYKAYHAYEKGTNALSTVNFITTAVKAVQKTMPIFKILLKIINDITVEFSGKHNSPNFKIIILKAFNRVQKELLTSIGETLLKTGEESFYEQFEESSQRATRKEKQLKKLQTKGPPTHPKTRIKKRHGHKKKIRESTKKRKKKFQRKISDIRQKVSRQKRFAKKSLAIYASRLILRRLSVNLINEFIKFSENYVLKQLNKTSPLSLTSYKDAIKKKLPIIVLSITTSTAREVTMDVLKKNTKMNKVSSEQIADLLSKHIQKIWQGFIEKMVSKI